MTPSPIRTLLAASDTCREVVVAALGSGHEVVHARTLQQARSLVRLPLDLIVCGLCFDESRMFDLLRQAKSDEASKVLPFLAVKGTDGELSPAVLQGIEIACAALGAEKFIELTEWERRDGKEVAHQRFRAVIRHILAAA